MREFHAGSYDVAVIGAGHAGIEASLACARLGMKTVCFTINLDAVGNMPCNPAIGGTGKGHLVRELDALGGEMAKAADLACIQYRMLNRGKGPAVWSLRAQADRRRYQSVMKHTLETQENLLLRQAEIVDLRVTDGHVSAVVTETGGVYAVGAVILCSGTFLDGRTIVGECVRESGPDGMHAATELQKSLVSLGLSLRRFKTGTPARIHRKSVDFSALEAELNIRAERLKARRLDEFFTGMLNKRLGQIIIKNADLGLSNSVNTLTRQDIKRITALLKDMRFKITGTTGFANSQVTAGGLDTAQFNCKTMESRDNKGLYAIGEILDIDGDCGGFNLQWAWSSALCAAENIAGANN